MINWRIIFITIRQYFLVRNIFKSLIKESYDRSKWMRKTIIYQIDIEPDNNF